MGHTLHTLNALLQKLLVENFYEITYSPPSHIVKYSSSTEGFTVQGRHV